MPKNDKFDEAVKKHPYVAARQMPNSYQAEVALLGSMIIDGKTASDYIPQLKPDDFYTPAHRCIFEALSTLFGAAKTIDFVTLTGQLESSGTFEMSGGVENLSKIVDAVPSVANTGYYFDIVKKDARLRSIIEIARKMADEAYALDPDDKALDRAEAALYSLAEQSRRGKPEPIYGFVKTVLDDLKERAKDNNQMHGVPTGFMRLDNLLGGGFQNSDLIILAARPGQGKTSFAMNCAVNAAFRKRPHGGPSYAVAIFSLEMSANQLAKRILCSVGDYDMSRANRAIIDEKEWIRLQTAGERLGKTRMYVDESGDITPAEILSKCRALKHSVGLDFVMIDYLQLMQSGKRTDNFVREIAEITRALKLAAKELNVPILLLSQMSRSIEQRKGNDKESKLSDLRDSGAIEQDADIVMFIDRKEAPAPEGGNGAYSKPAVSEVYLNVAKHRNGATGNIKLIWNPSTTTFKDDPKNAPADDPLAYKNAKSDGGFEPPAQNGFSNDLSVEDAFESGLMDDRS